MAQPYELTRLDPITFEHLVNMLAMRVIGDGLTGFGPGADGGRDGYFEGTAPYPSLTDRWSGTWYIQSKFHRPQLSGNPQTWLVEKIQEEINEFKKPRSRRKLPRNWIIATNIEPSGVPETGAFDKASDMVMEQLPGLEGRFHIWGGSKVLDLLARYPECGEYYAEFLTPGQFLTAIFHNINDVRAQADQILRYFLVSQFDEQKHTKLDQAGSTTDNRPGIHRLFVDIPIVASTGHKGMAAAELAKTISYDHSFRNLPIPRLTAREWELAPRRARIWLVKGGPGQGKSTVTQFICQLQRAALLNCDGAPPLNPMQIDLINEIRDQFQGSGFWPLVPRIPVVVELREFAQWYGRREDTKAVGVATYLAETLSKKVEQPTHCGTLLRMFSSSKWLFVFDGLDEVPGDVKDGVSSEVVKFVNDTLIGSRSDAVVVCTSRPQGYSGQLDSLNSAVVELSKLTPDQALSCAEPVLRIDRSVEQSAGYIKILAEAILSPAVREIMTTPLQAHIMAVVVRDGSKPPERKWTLFNRFYTVIKTREANRSLPNLKLARLLHEDRLLKAIHNRLGFELHKKAETAVSKPAESMYRHVSFLTRDEFEVIARETVEQLQEEEVESTVNVLMEATTDRLVLVSTPESGAQVRFDIRPLQEFFAAEYMYDLVEAKLFEKRVSIIAADSHWREVMHFLMSALIENTRQTELSLATQILTNINSHPDSGETQVLFRQLALGALIVSRLVEEGVLGQDKRVRLQMQACLEPLLASYELFEGITSADGIHTRQWLISLLLRQLSEKAPAGNAGACAALFTMLPDENEHVADVGSFFSSSTIDYKGAVVKLLEEYYVVQEGRLPRWALTLLVGLKLDCCWHLLGRSCLAALDNLLNANESLVYEIAEAFGVRNDSRELWKALLLESGMRMREPDAPSELMSRPYGLLEASCRGPIVNWRSFSNENWAMLQSSSGLLATCYSILLLASADTDANLQRVVTSVAGRKEALQWVPEAITSWIPKERRLALGLPSPWMQRELPIKEGMGYVCDFMIKAGQGEERQDWERLFLDAPLVGLSMIYSYDGREADAGKTFVLKDERNQKALLNGLAGRPDDIARSVYLWGNLVDLDPAFSEEFRATLLHCASRPKRTYRFFEKMPAFALQLPKEAALLPHILYFITESEKIYSPGDAEADEGSRSRSLRLHVAGFVKNSGDLDGIIENRSLDSSVRGAANLMSLILNPNQHSAGQEALCRIPHFATKENLFWYLKSSARALSELVLQGHPPALQIMGALLETGRMDFVARSNVQNEIEYWRETSRAPVTQALSKGQNPF